MKEQNLAPMFSFGIKDKKIKSEKKSNPLKGENFTSKNQVYTQNEILSKILKFSLFIENNNL